MKTKRYLGDGVYAEYDGYQIALTADRGGQRNRIYLDWHTREALLKFIGEVEVDKPDFPDDSYEESGQTVWGDYDLG
jgi:hypothetical protein